MPCPGWARGLLPWRHSGRKIPCCRAPVIADSCPARCSPPDHSPAWYRWAIDQIPERSTFECDGVPVELLTWGEVGKPGLLFLHGDSAHADWWSYTAPFFADEWRCAAISWTGMGSSGRRPGYTFDAWAREAIAAIDAAALDNGTGTMVVAHSLGGYPAQIGRAHV